MCVLGKAEWKANKTEFERHASAFEPTLTEKFSLQIEEKII